MKVKSHIQKHQELVREQRSADVDPVIDPVSDLLSKAKSLITLIRIGLV